MNALLITAVVVFLVNLYAAVELIRGVRKMRKLNEVKLFTGEGVPKISVIVPACNEEETIEPALRTLLNQKYEAFEIIVVNDRSTDRTGEVLGKIKGEYPQLRVHEINKLPEGWLGKNNALRQGAKLASGEFLLFTDADILFEQTTLSRAMTIMVNEQVDHLALVFRNISRGLLLNAMMVDAGGALYFLFKPWKVNNPKSRNFVGVGAFNMVRKSAYREIGGHEEIKMHPIDDIMLGKIMKRNGFRQECLSGYDFLTVHWYESTAKMINGLMKNIFALFNFRVSYVAAAIIFVLIGTVLPFWAIFFTSGPVRVFCILAVATRLCSFSYGTRHTGTTYWSIPFAMITPYINIYIILKGMLKTFQNNGIDWRGTHYPLESLRENQPIL